MSFVMVSAIVSGLGLLSSADSARRNSNTQRDAQKRADANNKKLQIQQDQENNKLNAKSPDLNAYQSANVDAAKVGGSGTMLTGVQGVNPGAVSLGKTTLLGL